MAISKDLFLAILSMDAYNRGYDPGIAGLGGSESSVGDSLGNAVVTNENRRNEAKSAGFYAVAYDTEYGTVISYRGTDNPDVLLSGEGGSGSDVWQGWITGLGFMGPQAYLAADFYQAVTGTSESDPRTGSVTLTGHSLGGGLAGLVGALYHQKATLFNNMPFELAAQEAYTAATRLFPSEMVLEQLYNNLTPWETLIGVNLHTYAVTGEILTPGRFDQTTPETYLDSHGGPRLPSELHSQEFRVIA